MVSYQISVEEDGRSTRIVATARFFYLILALMFITIQVMSVLVFGQEAAGSGGLWAFLLGDAFFCLILYLIASWCPFRMELERDDEDEVLRFHAMPGCWRRKIYPLSGISALEVEDRGDYVGRLYVIAGGRQRVKDLEIKIAKDFAARAGELLGLQVLHT